MDKSKWDTSILKSIAFEILDGDWIESKDQSDKGIRLIQTGNIGEGIFKNKVEKAHYISEDTFTRLRCTEIFPNDILVSRLPDPVGRACILPNINSRCITAVDCSIIRLKDKVLSQWLIYYTQSDDYKVTVRELCTGSTRQRITRKNLEKIHILVPPLAEQQEIVDYLDKAFAKIDALKKNAEQQLSDAKALFSAALEESMSPKEGWTHGVLGDFLNFRRGHDLTHNQMKKGQIPVAGSSGIIGYHNEETPIHPCITIGRSGSVGKIFIYDRCWAHNTTLYIDDYKGNNPYFLKYLILNLQLGEFHGGSAVPTLNRNSLHPIPTASPSSLPEQQTIVAHLDALSSKVNQLQENYNKILRECDALKQALLREIFE